MKRMLWTGALAVVIAAAGVGAANAQVSPQDFAAAHAEITNLSNRLMIASDAQDAETYARSFAKEGVLDWVYGVEHGREEIRKAIAAWRGRTEKMAPDAKERQRTRHFVMNQVIDIAPDGKTGKGLLYWMALTNRTPQKDVQLLYFGHVVENYVKEDGKWLFAKREVFNESLHNHKLFYPELGEIDPRGAAK